MKKLVGLYNRKNYPVTVTYKGRSFVLAPKSKTKKEFERSELFNIDPKEITII